MNEINSFTFYKNYYDIIKYLENEDKLIMLMAILEYVFEDKEPELEGLNLGIWNNIKMPLNTTKTNIINGKKGGRPKTETKTQTITETKPKLKANNISTFLFLLSNNNFYKDRGLLRGKIEEWLNYKWERKEYYKETGFKTLLARIESATSLYGVENIVSLIDECMANNYKGIIFEKLKGKKVEKTPDWFNEVKEPTKATKEEKQEMEKLLKEFE